jgi:hypothetical protein
MDFYEKRKVKVMIISGVIFFLLGILLFSYAFPNAISCDSDVDFPIFLQIISSIASSLVTIGVLSIVSGFRLRRKKCSYLKCKYGDCIGKSTCWTHQHTKTIFDWNKFMKMTKESEEIPD